MTPILIVINLNCHSMQSKIGIHYLALLELNMIHIWYVLRKLPRTRYLLFVKSIVLQSVRVRIVQSKSPIILSLKFHK